MSMKRLTLDQARSIGLTRYLPQYSCKHGHTGYRYTRTDCCCECTRIALLKGRKVKIKKQRVDDIYDIALSLMPRPKCA